MASTCETQGSHELACRLSQFLGGPFVGVGEVHAAILVIGVVGALLSLYAQYALRFRYALPVVCSLALLGSGLCIALAAYGIDVLASTGSHLIPNGVWSAPADAPPVDPFQSTVIDESGGSSLVRNLFIALFVLHVAHCVIGTYYS